MIGATATWVNRGECIATVLGVERTQASAVTERLLDIGGHDLGRPAAVVAVRSKDELREAMARARAESRPLVAMGLRATYWQNLSVEGALVVDLTCFDRILATEPIDGYVTVESGVALRQLDLHLRAHGGHLAMHPDAYGDTPVGASFANGTTAGIGMLWGSFADQVLGLEIMLGDGTTVQMGASRMLRAGGGAVAQGIPDLRSLFFGAEGALGVVTEIDVAIIPAPWEARMTWDVAEDRFAEVLAAAQHWRRRGCIETMRWSWNGVGQLFVGVGSRVGPEELEQRILAVQKSLAGWPSPTIERATDDERRGARPDYDRKWPGPPGSTWKNAARAPFAGVDAFVPYRRAAEAYAWARALTLPVARVKRVAAYVGRDGMNIGVHCMFPDEATRALGRTELEGRLPELAALDAVPYRPGVVWTRHLRGRWDARTLEAMRAVARVLDPVGRVPGAGMLSEPTPDGRGEP